MTDNRISPKSRWFGSLLVTTEVVNNIPLLQFDSKAGCVGPLALSWEDVGKLCDCLNVFLLDALETSNEAL